MRFLGRSLMGLFLLAVTAGLLAFAGDLVWGALQTRMAEESSSRPARERVFSVNVITVAPETIRPVLATFGEVRSRRTLELRSSASGEVIWLSDAFEEGGRVLEGDVLVRVDPVEAESALATARADENEARRDLRDAERALALARDEIRAAEDQERLRLSAVDRQRDLLARNVGSQAALEAAELSASSASQSVLSRRQAEANAEARLEQARTALERRGIALAEAERRLAETEIAAPFSGVIGGDVVTEGRLVARNERIGELIDPTSLEIAFRVSTPQYARLLSESGALVGAPVTAGLDVFGVDLSVQGVISRESAAVAAGQTGRLIFASIEEAPGFRPGDFVSVRVEEPPLDRVSRLPAAAVDAAGTVLVLGDEERLEVAPVEVLRREGDDVIVRARALAGREIVAERTPLLGAGIKVRPLRPEAQAEAPPQPQTLSLDPERRAKLVAFVEGNAFMPDDVKERVLTQLKQDQVPARVVERIESRMGG